ncbi:glycosyl hydrolase BNR repeat-containing protein [Halosimplex carlsbadense 2-9-1]|uniref:Glycosyl hydrolase BNR repeat-containing protein n=1 Tax=Halosimplex carlsbadense 2-9-1 TaxID=797114 RepID=M0CIJ9_9EURY|nr:hypothetical protein [Halosimplex carlsbadense]ELZ23105.1 glycosyl hydrolase BNR repeat-containing protein [Halosimplex carlsbadense 2-9-1]
MQLGGIRNQVGYCAAGRRVSAWRPGSGITDRGTIPCPGRGLDRLRFRVLNAGRTKRLLGPLVGAYTTTNVWPVGAEGLVATVGRRAFVSSDGGRSWSVTRELPASSGPMGVLPTSLCEHDGELYLAEYPLGDEDARVLASDDDGRSWSPYHVQEDARHFHGLFHDPYGGRLWATTGDTDRESAVGYFDDGRFRPVGSGSQRWRAVGLAFTPDAVLWGMDCPYVDTVELLALPRDRIGAAEPEPETVGTTTESVYYVETLSVGGESVVVAATAAECGTDSTAPTAERADSGSRTARVLAATSATGYREWRELCSFTRRSSVGESLSALPAASAYVFVRANDELGLVINPYNTSRHHGEILQVPPSDLERLLFDDDPEAVPTVGGPGRSERTHD